MFKAKDRPCFELPHTHKSYEEVSKNSEGLPISSDSKTGNFVKFFGNKIRYFVKKNS